MSSGSSWLKAQRKQELVGLAQEAGLKDYESLKKADLETALEEKLRANQDSLSKNTQLAPFYKKSGGSSAAPAAKKESSTAGPIIEVKTPAIKKRVVKAKEDVATAVDDAAKAIAKTPSAVSKQLIPANVPLPPSPAAVASHIDRQITRGKSKLNQVVKDSGVTEYTDLVRDQVSTALAVQTIAIGIEAWNVFATTLTAKRAFTIPGIGTYIAARPVELWDFFNLVTADFWYPFTFWVISSIGLPLLFSFFFNLTLKAKSLKHATRSQPSASQFDPLTFNLFKALIQWVVYSQNFAAFGYPSLETKSKIEAGMPFGHQGVIVASLIGVVLSLYEAILKK